MCAYKYPDTYGKFFWKNIYNELWQDGGLEDKYLAECINKIPEDKRNYLLDIGCGLGRLTKKFSLWFENILAIDPDIAHLKQAIKLMQKLTNNSCSIKFENLTAQELQTNTMFDCVICSHVIQHITQQAVYEIFTKARDLLSDNGFLILSTANFIENEDEFSKVNVKTGDYASLTARDFDKCVEENNEWMPTRLFKDDDITNTLEKHGFKIISIKKYHGYPKIRGDKLIFASKA